MAARSPRDKTCEALERVVVAWAIVLAGALAVIGCGGANNVACTTDLDCQSTFVCVADPALDGARCMRECAEEDRLCDDGSVCTAFAGGRACFPGGSVGVGEACTANLACEAGTVCVPSLRRCLQACDGVSPVCALTEICRDDATVGAYCVE